MNRTTPLLFHSLLVLIQCSVFSAASANAANPWPSFRGPTGQGIAIEKKLPSHWSETENVAWRTEIPGKGWSSPVIWGDQIWMTTAIERIATDAEKRARLKDEKQADQLQVAAEVSLRAVCVHTRTGKLLENVELALVENPEAIHALNSYASPTPVVTEDRVYFHFGTYGTFCLDRATAQLNWKRRLPLEHAVGPGSSPVVWQNLLILVCDGMDQQYVTALDRLTGDEIWKTDRPKMEGENGDFHKAFGTPLLIEWDGGTQLLVPGAQWFVSYEPSDGRTLWKINHGKGFSNVAAPIFSEGIGYLITGFTKPELWAIPVKNRGILTRVHVLWEQKKQVPKKSSPQLIDTEIYMVSDSGVLSCLDRDSGELNWSARLGGNYSASPLFCDGKIYFCSHEGVVTVVKPNAEKFEKLAENQLDGQIMASPAPADGALFVRTDQALYRIE